MHKTLNMQSNRIGSASAPPPPMGGGPLRALIRSRRRSRDVGQSVRGLRPLKLLAATLGRDLPCHPCDRSDLLPMWGVAPEGLLPMLTTLTNRQE